MYFTLISYDPSQEIKMLTIVANLVTEFECVVFGFYIHIQLHYASCLK